MILAVGDLVWIALIQVVFGGIVTGAVAIAMKWLDLEAKKRDAITAEKLKVTAEKIEEVRKTTDGIIPALVAAGALKATHEERDRVAAVAEAEAVKESEIARRVDAATSGAVTSAVATNVEIIKEDVKAVQEDVQVVKAEVVEKKAK